MVKVHQEAVDTFLEDVILNTVERTADDEARRYVQYMAKRIDEAAEEAARRKDTIEREELVADLLHSFLLPEVEKRRLRDRHLAKQQNLLRAAHEEIFGRLLRPRPSGAELPPVPEPPLLEFFPEAKPWQEPFPEQASVAERLAEIPPDPACWQGSDQTIRPDQLQAVQEEEEVEEVEGEEEEEEEEEETTEELLGERDDEMPHGQRESMEVQIMKSSSESEDGGEDQELTEMSATERGIESSSEAPGEDEESGEENEPSADELMKRLMKEMENAEDVAPDSQQEVEDEQ